MNSHVLLAALAITASLLTACGQSNPSAADSKAQPATAPATAPAPALATAPAPAPTAELPSAQQAAAPAQVSPAMKPAVTVSLTKSGQLVIQGLASKVPAAWTPSPTSNNMRIAQFALPTTPGAEAGEVVAYYFSSGQGGSREANIERWASQFSSADGKLVVPKISTSKSGDTEVTVVELQGTYTRGVGMGPTGGAKPDQTLIIAMIETSIGQIILHMYGPNKPISLQRDNFLNLAKGFRPV